MAIIQEKGLVRAIKGAYRHGGYNVLNLDGDVVVTQRSGASGARGTNFRARRWTPSWNTWA